MAGEERRLPDAAVELIAAAVLVEGQPCSNTLNLLAMCGVCQQWRSIAREVPAPACIGFEGADNGTFPSAPVALRLRKLSPPRRQALFLSAARLLTGYTSVRFTGDCITDETLEALAVSGASRKLKKVAIVATPAVTDKGLCRLIENSPHLQQVVVEDLHKSVSGYFLRVLSSCKEVGALRVVNLPGLNWVEWQASMEAGWRGTSLTKLQVQGCNVNQEVAQLLQRLPALTELGTDACPAVVCAAAQHCPLLTRLSYQVSTASQIDEVLWALSIMKNLRSLQLICNVVLSSEQLKVIGMLPVNELRINSFMYKQQPSLSRSQFSHLDNEGVKALVDSICTRCFRAQAVHPLKLSLCGATTVGHEAVSALLRLPVLTELDIGGCAKITAMDKMRLVAKVKAGRELYDSRKEINLKNHRFPGLVL